MNTTFLDHLARVDRALDYIEENLIAPPCIGTPGAEPLAIEAIAARAAFSPWHFQRVFGAMVGESVMGYIRRRRLSLAMVALATTQKRIIDIAWEHRFESQESFTRSFKSQFGVTPGQFRRQGRCTMPPHGRARITPERLDTLLQGNTMEPNIQKLPERKVVGLGATFVSILSPDRTNHIVIPQLWDQFIRRIDEIPNRIGEYSLGLCADLPEGMVRTRDDEFYYMACAEVSSFDTMPEGMIGRVVPEATFAIFTHTGSLEGLGATMNYIYGRWLPESSYNRPADIPDLEFYDQRFNPESPDSELDIYIPIA